MCDAIAHRGPDDSGAHVVPGVVGIGFRRLSIIDLEHGHQPLWTEDRSTCVTCNGEIYNFAELRRRLEAGAHTLATGSDSEVIAHLYEERGPDLLHALRGMFALALWDGRAQRLLLARDRLGVKPLYWAEVPGGLLYASEPGAILASGLVEVRPDDVAIAQYLTLQYVPPPRSGFAEIHKLAPGELLLWERGQATVRRWWTLAHGAPTAIDDGEAIERVDAALSEATRLRMIADVSVGAFLSGGIDSSLVTSYMAEHASDVRTFSIGFPSDRYTETAHAREVSSLYGTTHEEFVVEPDLVPTVAEAARVVGEPFADSSAIPTYLLSRLTRRHVTVALSGDGGDEAFAGYVRHRIAVAADRLGPLPALAGPFARAALALAPADSRTGRIARGLQAAARNPHDRYASLMSHFDPPGLEALCEPAFLARAGGSRDAWDRVLKLPPITGVDRYLALDTATYLPGDLLVKADRMSMAHALEVRSPFLDHHVMELAADLPGDLKLRRGETKWVLKQVARRRRLPDHLVYRQKQGFAMPVAEWFRKELRGWVDDVLRDPRTRGRGWFRPAAVDRLIDDHAAGRANHAHRLWNLLMLELWHRAWIDA
jgi:asparagine synthase (glutamine-hydrolysing)